MGGGLVACRFDVRADGMFVTTGTLFSAFIEGNSPTSISFNASRGLVYWTLEIQLRERRLGRDACKGRWLSSVISVGLNLSLSF